MPNCTEEFGAAKIEFGRMGRREVEGRFDGGSMTSDGVVMLIGDTDRKLGLLDAAARCIADPRNSLLIKHAVRAMLTSGWLPALHDAVEDERAAQDGQARQYALALRSVLQGFEHVLAQSLGANQRCHDHHGQAQQYGLVDARHDGARGQRQVHPQELKPPRPD